MRRTEAGWSVVVGAVQSSSSLFLSYSARMHRYFEEMRWKKRYQIYDVSFEGVCYRRRKENKLNKIRMILARFRHRGCSSWINQSMPPFPNGGKGFSVSVCTLRPPPITTTTRLPLMAVPTRRRHHPCFDRSPTRPSTHPLSSYLIRYPAINLSYISSFITPITLNVQEIPETKLFVLPSRDAQSIRSIYTWRAQLI